jgi:hypothetical protein
VPKGVTLTPGDIVVDVACKARHGYSDTLFEVAVSSAPNQKNVAGVFTWQGPFNGFVPAALQGETIKTGQVDEDGNQQSVTLPAPEYADISAAYDNASFNAIGEGQINVCGEGGNLDPGDYITSSSTPGKGMRQSDDVVHGYTVAKCRESVTFDSPSEIKVVACFYVCG